MNKKLLITSALFILVSCSDGFIKLEERIKSHAIKNNIEMSYFQVKKEALYLYQWSKKEYILNKLSVSEKQELKKKLLNLLNEIS